MNKSPIQPHNAEQVVKCSGSVLMQIQNPPSDTGDESITLSRLEGRAFHDIAERMLTAYKPDGELVSRIQTIGSMSKDNIVITDEIFDAAEDFANDVITDCNGMLSKLNVEKRIELGHLFPGCYGFADAWLYDKDTHHLRIWEGKFGHRFVDVFENYQLLSYVSGIIEQLGISGHQELSLKVTMKVVQPRCFHHDGPIREWSDTAANLRCYFNILKSSFEDAYSDPKCKVNDTCGTCHARYSCEAYTLASFSAYEYCGEVFDNSLSGSDLSIELKIVNHYYDIIKNRKSALDAQAISELRAGQQVPGYQLLQGMGRKRWKQDIDVDQLIMMGDVMGEDIRKPAQLLTPTQVIKKGIDESVINLYSETPMTSFKLVDDSKSANARQTFSK